jgi:hypothetical protein
VEETEHEGWDVSFLEVFEELGAGVGVHEVGCVEAGSRAAMVVVEEEETIEEEKTIRGKRCGGHERCGLLFFVGIKLDDVEYDEEEGVSNIWDGVDDGAKGIVMAGVARDIHTFEDIQAGGGSISSRVFGGSGTVILL